MFLLIGDAAPHNAACQFLLQCVFLTSSDENRQVGLERGLERRLK